MACPNQIARPWTYEQEPGGELGLIADREREVLIGAWAVAPLASEWIHQAALAIKTEIRWRSSATRSRNSRRSPRHT